MSIEASKEISTFLQSTSGEISEWTVKFTKNLYADFNLLNSAATIAIESKRLILEFGRLWWIACEDNGKPLSSRGINVKLLSDYLLKEMCNDPSNPAITWDETKSLSKQKGYQTLYRKAKIIGKVVILSCRIYFCRNTDDFN
jgi:hypothetical protein